MSRPWTAPIRHDNGGTTVTVKRSCEVCGRALGDATQTELDNALAGTPLPPVAGECGCAHTIQQLALHENYIDQHESGTPVWDDLDPVGRDSYLQAATRTLRAIITLGYLPNGAPSDINPTNPVDARSAAWTRVLADVRNTHLED